ncbi:unnamed protein product [Caenorhabditis bovis]|uniref:Uncharacterized protein n=1 Tax=Caenorhabditis bovis TaxID=2654633 RepID=A0A8S1F9B8_9PELO|nr:unnamed protein product [Caenorhabditis bovis]
MADQWGDFLPNNLLFNLNANAQDAQDDQGLPAFVADQPALIMQASDNSIQQHAAQNNLANFNGQEQNVEAPEIGANFDNMEEDDFPEFDEMLANMGFMGDGQCGDVLNNINGSCVGHANPDLPCYCWTRLVGNQDIVPMAVSQNLGNMVAVEAINGEQFNNRVKMCDSSNGSLTPNNLAPIFNNLTLNDTDKYSFSTSGLENMSNMMEPNEWADYENGIKIGNGMPNQPTVRQNSSNIANGNRNASSNPNGRVEFFIVREGSQALEDLSWWPRRRNSNDVSDAPNYFNHIFENPNRDGLDEGHDDYAIPVRESERLEEILQTLLESTNRTEIRVKLEDQFLEPGEISENERGHEAGQNVHENTQCSICLGDVMTEPQRCGMCRMIVGCKPYEIDGTN